MIISVLTIVYRVGSVVYSLAVSVKMNILLYIPALLLVYLAVLGIWNTFLQVRLNRSPVTSVLDPNLFAGSDQIIRIRPKN